MKTPLFDSIYNALCSVFYLVYLVFFKNTDEINFILIENVWVLDLGYGSVGKILTSKRT